MLETWILVHFDWAIAIMVSAVLVVWCIIELVKFLSERRKIKKECFVRQIRREVYKEVGLYIDYERAKAESWASDNRDLRKRLETAFKTIKELKAKGSE